MRPVWLGARLWRPIHLAMRRKEDDCRKLMGDKSPKATQKQASQKQVKTNTVNKQKNVALALKQSQKPKK